MSFSSVSVSLRPDSRSALGFLNGKSGLKIAETLGEVISVEDPEGRGKLQKFIRVRFWVDITKPLKKGCFLKRPEKEDLWVKFKYECLSDFCYGCGRVSHMINDCMVVGGEMGSPKAYDSSLRAEVSWLDTINFGSRIPEKMIYPNSKGKANQDTSEGRSPQANGGVYRLASGVRGDSTKGHLDSTVVGRGNTLVENFDVLQKGQVASREVDICSNGTKECALLSDKEFTTPSSTDKTSRGNNAIPSLGLSPIFQSSNKVLKPNTQYFVEEPDSPRAFPAGNLGLEVDLGVSSPIPKPLSPSHSDVGLSVIFNRLLSLKRKASEDLDSEAILKNSNSLVEAGPQSVNSETAFAVPNRSFAQEKGKAPLREIILVHKDNPLVQEEVSTWWAPDFGKFKANCDVAISITKNASKAAVVLRNWKGKVVEGAAKTVSTCSSLGGELFAIRAAYEMLLRLGMKEVVVESVNKQAITLSVFELVPPWNVRALVLDIR
ncbi:hypothetical protein RHMOL_Rhmol06G0135400 [Rhododendron molle]|uniref:Uncharacterized protein n=1 Tax=Rhododendron molle TaxID=49168 RepID=A0ACC0NCK0_RHOML|nr:hypothetical protein RHMOL_Rhmol06G0135400 [Rhododendron molle]